MENENLRPVPNPELLNEMIGRIREDNKRFLEINPLDIIAVSSRVQDYNLAGETIELSDGTKIRARDVLDHEHSDAFVRGWLPWRHTEVFKRVWLQLKKGEKGINEKLEFTIEEESIVFLAQQEIEFWVAYYAMYDYNEKLRSVRDKEMAIEILKRHPMISEIVRKILDITALSKKGQGAGTGFHKE